MEGNGKTMYFFVPCGLSLLHLWPRVELQPRLPPSVHHKQLQSLWRSSPAPRSQVQRSSADWHYNDFVFKSIGKCYRLLSAWRDYLENKISVLSDRNNIPAQLSQKEIWTVHKISMPFIKLKTICWILTKCKIKEKFILTKLMYHYFLVCLSVHSLVRMALIFLCTHISIFTRFPVT